MRAGFLRRADRRPSDPTGNLARKDRRIHDLEASLKRLSREVAKHFGDLQDQKAENRRLAAVLANRAPLWVGRQDAAAAELARVLHEAMFASITTQEARLVAEVAVEWFVDEMTKAAAVDQACGS